MDKEMADIARRRVARLYRSAAISNFLVTVPAFVAYRRYIDSFFSEKPNYPFLVHIWSGMAFLWGVMFWEIAKDPVKKQDLVKYSYLEKAVTSASVVAAVALHDKQKSAKLPLRVLAGVSLTDIVWIPLFVRAHGKLRTLCRGQDA
ncbi:MAG: hypothetical protein M3186_03370 [Actinomycetota bacterium]|nr:hypothetical protein [Actinomycetota bacterium]